MSILTRVALSLLIPILALGVPRGVPAAGNRDLATLGAASLQRGHAPARTVVRWLLRQADVRTAWVSADGATIRVSFRDGLNAAILPKPSPASVPVKSLARLRAGGVRPLARAGVSTATAAVLEPYATELYSNQTDIAAPIVAALQSAGFTVTHLVDQQVTVAAMKTLAKYDLVYYEGHTGSGLVGTGQLYTGSTGDLGVIPAMVAGSTDTYAAVQPSFFQEYLGHFPANSLLFMNGCALLGDSATWGALHGKGLSTMVAWSGDSTAFAVAVNGSAFFNIMSQGKSVSDTITFMQANGLGTSQQDSGNSQLGFQGDGSLTLPEIAAGAAPAATPTPITPVATSTPRPTSTPTPTPTATLPPLTVAVSVRQQVKPGERQVITVHTGAPATIAAHVLFPNGGTRTLHGSTDAAGNATLSFVQPASRITHGHLSAHIRVEASDPGMTVTASARYRILFSPLDVSAMPHVARPHKKETIWVHARAKTTADVSVRFGNGRTFTYTLRIARSGWAKHSFRMPKALKGATVKVRATAKVHGKVRHASTSFVVG